MRKLVLLIFLSVILKSCATPVGNEYSQERKNKYVAVTHMWPKSGMKNFFTGYTFGIYKPHLFDFYSYSNISSEDAASKSEKKCLDFRNKKNWSAKANCKLSFARLTQFGERAKFDKSEQEREANEKKQKAIASKPKSESSSKTKKNSGSSGSAFFVNNNGYIITNYHVIQGCNNNPKIKYVNKDIDTNIIAKDQLLDLALLRAD